jgi:hypothetical protein
MRLRWGCKDSVAALPGTRDKGNTGTQQVSLSTPGAHPSGSLEIVEQFHATPGQGRSLGTYPGPAHLWLSANKGM